VNCVLPAWAISAAGVSCRKASADAYRSHAYARVRFDQRLPHVTALDEICQRNPLNRDAEDERSVLGIEVHLVHPVERWPGHASRRSPHHGSEGPDWVWLDTPAMVRAVAAHLLEFTDEPLCDG
jgi:hypothetical protein